MGSVISLNALNNQLDMVTYFEIESFCWISIVAYFKYLISNLLFQLFLTEGHVDRDTRKQNHTMSQITVV